MSNYIEQNSTISKIGNASDSWIILNPIEQSIKNKIEKLDITAQPDYINSEEEEVIVSPKIRVVISTYYKGTALDGAFKKLEEYIDSSNENTIRTI